MNKKPSLDQMSGTVLDIQMVYVTASVDVPSYYGTIGGMVTRNDEGFSEIVDRHLEEYSEVWQELARM